MSWSPNIFSFFLCNSPSISIWHWWVFTRPIFPRKPRSTAFPQQMLPCRSTPITAFPIHDEECHHFLSKYLQNVSVERKLIYSIGLTKSSFLQVWRTHISLPVVFFFLQESCRPQHCMDGNTFHDRVTTTLVLFLASY